MNALKLAVRELSNNYKEYVKRKEHRKARKLTESILLNLDVIHSLEGAKSSAQFEKKELRTVTAVKTRRDLFALCLQNVSIKGLYLEFGTFKADSINLLAKLDKKQHFYGFDSFQGMPEGWTPDCKQGTFDLGGKLPLVRKNVSLVPGWYDKSLPPFIAKHSAEKVAFLHIDCDLYSSTKTVLESLDNMIVPGTVICFDEYYNYPDWEEGEYKAFQEFLAPRGLAFDYLGYIRIGRQLAVKIKMLA
jgi:Macrocin-O-methyltransferase (TylF)